MDYFRYKDGHLQAEDVPVADLAEKHGTPLYVYSARTLVEHFRKLRDAFAAGYPADQAPIICYSIKANSNLSILKLMADEGSGFDVVSGGELHRALKIGATPDKLVFAGVGKTDEEIRAGLEHDILMFNVESEDELLNIDRLAGAAGKKARVALRINPDVDPQTHKYISTGKKESKFGVDLVRAKEILGRARDLANIDLCGLHVHIGSQITKVDPYVESLTRVSNFLPECEKAGFKIKWLDIGGGFGIWYKDKLARPAAEIAEAILPILQKTGCRLILEPGRFISGNAGILLTRVLYVKESGGRKFVICDAGMNDLLRPTLYGAYHRVWPVETDPNWSGEVPDEEHWKGPTSVTDLVGPICETGDFFAKERPLPPLKRGDLVAVFSVGAYGYVMASNYNSHPRPCEVVVAGKEAKVVTERESLEHLLQNERIVSFSLT